jgi:flagellar protein FliJ
MRSMKKSARLQPVRKLADNKAKSAAIEMAEAQQSHSAHQQKLTDLKQYKIEYLEQFQERAKAGISAGQLQQYQQFINQLDAAIKQQQDIVSSAGQQLSHKQANWRDKHTHKQAVDKVVGRFKQQELHKENKQEQAQTDEHNTQQAQRNKPAP